VDVGFFEEDDAPKETMPSTLTFMSRGGSKTVLQAPKEDMPTHQLKKEESKQVDTSSFIK